MASNIRRQRCPQGMGQARLEKPDSAEGPNLFPPLTRMCLHDGGACSTTYQSVPNPSARHGPESHFRVIRETILLELRHMAEAQVRKLEQERDRLSAELRTLSEAISTRAACEE